MLSALIITTFAVLVIVIICLIAYILFLSKILRHPETNLRAQRKILALERKYVALLDDLDFVSTLLQVERILQTYCDTQLLGSADNQARQEVDYSHFFLLLPSNLTYAPRTTMIYYDKKNNQF